MAARRRRGKLQDGLMSKPQGHRAGPMRPMRFCRWLRGRLIRSSRIQQEVKLIVLARTQAEVMSLGKPRVAAMSRASRQAEATSIAKAPVGAKTMVGLPVEARSTAKALLEAMPSHPVGAKIMARALAEVMITVNPPGEMMTMEDPMPEATIMENPVLEETTMGSIPAEEESRAKATRMGSLL